MEGFVGYEGHLWCQVLWQCSLVIAFHLISFHLIPFHLNPFHLIPFHLTPFHLISFFLFYLHLISSFLVLFFSSYPISSHFIPFCLVSFLHIGIRIDRAMVRSLQLKVRSRHSKVRSLHQISYFANNIRYFAPCCNVKYYFPMIFKVLQVMMCLVTIRVHRPHSVLQIGHRATDV